MNDFAWIALFLLVAVLLARTGFEAIESAARVIPAPPVSQAAAVRAK